MRDRAEPGAQHDRADGLPERQTEEQHADDADEDRRELQVGRGPGPEQLQGPAVSLRERDGSAPPGSTAATLAP